MIPGKLERIPLVAFVRLWGWQRWLFDDSLKLVGWTLVPDLRHFLSKSLRSWQSIVNCRMLKYPKLFAFQELISFPPSSFLTNQWTLPMRYWRLRVSRSFQFKFVSVFLPLFTNFSRWSQCCPCWEQCLFSAKLTHNIVCEVSHSSILGLLQTYKLYFYSFHCLWIYFLLTIVTFCVSNTCIIGLRFTSLLSKSKLFFSHMLAVSVWLVTDISSLCLCPQCPVYYWSCPRSFLFNSCPWKCPCMPLLMCIKSGEYVVVRLRTKHCFDNNGAFIKAV